jgi:hypothetical protein
MTPTDDELAAEHRREETVTDDIRGDHDSPWSYGPWDIPSYAERASEDA